MEDTPIIVNVIKINARYFLYEFKFNMDDIIIFTDLFSDFFRFHLRSMKILYSVTIINNDKKIERVVIIPNLLIGSKSVKEKLRKPTVVNDDVKKQVFQFFEFVI